MDSHCTAQLTFVLGGFLGQDVTFERLTAFNSTAWTDAEALFGAAFRLHFWHNTICPCGQLHFLMIAGGSKTLLFDACSHLLATACAAAFATSPNCRLAGKNIGLTLPPGRYSQAPDKANTLCEKVGITSSFSVPEP